MSGRGPSPAGGSVPPSAASSSTPLRSPAITTPHIPPSLVQQPGLARSTSASAVPSSQTTEPPSVVPALRPTTSVTLTPAPAPPPPVPVLAPAPVDAPAPAPASPQVQPPRQYPPPQSPQQHPGQQPSRQSFDADVVERRWQELTQQHQQNQRAESLQKEPPPVQRPQRQQQPIPQQQQQHQQHQQHLQHQQQWHSSQSPFPPHQQPHQPPHGPVRSPDPVMARRAPIVNPPRQAPPSAPPRTEPGFVDPRGGIPHPSPGRDYPRENLKIQDDYVRLTFAIEQSLSDAVRCAVRHNWQKCLLGTSYHQGFMLNALLDSVPPDVARGSVKGFGSNVVKNARVEFAAHLDTADIDEIADLILAKASDQFLDAALEARLRTIDAKPLINALARAERLGYEPDDIVEEPVGGQERVIPQNVPEPPPPMPGQAPPPKKQCRMCNRIFDKEPPYIYHLANQVCMQRPDGQEGFLFSCSNCGQGFENTYGLKYHDSTGACTKYAPLTNGTPAPKQSVPKPSVATPPVSVTNGAVRSHSKPPDTVLPATRPTATPVRPTPSQPLSDPQSSQQTVSPSGAAQKTPTTDPYAHLSEGQLAALNAELLRAEQTYSEKFREAGEITDPGERHTQMSNLKNSFGTRQSLIRKKWGVRLRERRTRAEIEAEKARMGLSHGSKVSSPAGPYGDQSTPTSSQTNGASYNAAKRARTEDGTQYGTGTRGTSDSSDLRRKTPTPGYPMLETTRAQPLPRPFDDDDNMSDSSSDNDDIPARLPDSVRQSLSASQR